MICLEGVVLDTTAARAEAALVAARHYPGIRGPLPELEQLVGALARDPDHDEVALAAAALRAAVSPDAPAAIVERALVAEDYRALYWGPTLYEGVVGRPSRLAALRGLPGCPGFIDDGQLVRDRRDIDRLGPAPRVAISPRPRVEVLYNLLRFELTASFDAVLCREDADPAGAGSTRERLLDAACGRYASPPTGVFAVTSADRAAATARGLALLTGPEPGCRSGYTRPRT